MNYRAQVEEWIFKAENRLSDELDRRSNRSSRQSSSSRSSRSSRRSIMSERIKTKARLAELLTEKSMLQQQKSLEIQQNELELDVKIAKMRAREQVLAETDQGITVTNSIQNASKDDISKGKIDMCVGTDSEKMSHVNNVNVTSNNTNICQSNGNTQSTADNDVMNGGVNMQSKQNDVKNDIYVNNLPSNMHAGLDKSVYNMVSSVTTQNETSVNVSELNPQALTFHSNSNNSSNDVQKQIRDIATFMSLPAVEVPKFNGDPTEYNTFILAFDTRITPRTTSDTDRLYYLQQHLVGEPRELIEGCTYMAPDKGYYQARQLLQYEYGDPHKISSSYLNTLLRWKPIYHDDSVSLRKFSLFLMKCYNAMQNMSNLSVLNYTPNLQAIIGKLPAYLQNKWRDRTSKIRLQEQRAPQYDDVVYFVRSAAESANDPAFSKEALHQAERSTSRSTGNSRITHGNKSKSSSFAVGLQQTSQETTELPSSTKNTHFGRKCHYCSKSHDIETCQEFLKLSINDRRQFLKEQRLCFGCFGFNHLSKGCLKKRTCQTCGKRHPTSLHVDNFNPAEISSSYKKDTSTKPTSVSSCATYSSDCTVLQSIIPVHVKQRGQNTSVCTYAFYDPGSTGCFILDDIVDSLNLTGCKTALKLRTMHGVSYVNTTVINNLLVADLQFQNVIELPRTYSRSDIPVNHDQIPRPEMLERWPHLKSIANQIPEYNPDWQIGILIGSSCPTALEPIDVLPMQDGSPYAVRYRHGWTINGPLHVKLSHNKDIISCNRIVLQEVEHTKEILSPREVLRVLESDFKHCQVDVPGERGHSLEDAIFLEKAASSIKLVHGHYQLPLPFRNPDIVLPNNKGQAIKRALYQKRKMLQNQKYCTDYVQFVTKVLEKGYAAKVPKSMIQTAPGRVWYLPHHGVYHPRKPNKIRVVFDCSCKFNGISLNDCLIPGPDLTCSLVGVLTRFREHEIAFTGDIESMFYQVSIPEDQYSFLRFLWWPDGDLHAELEEYHMKVHLFGSVSSPSISNFALRQIVKDNEAELHPDVSHTIQRNFYVDDCLRSLPTVEMACKVLQGVTDACSMGSFRLTKFAANNVKVLQSIPVEEHSKECSTMELDYDSLPVERTLGVQWSMDNDTFGFNI